MSRRNPPVDARPQVHEEYLKLLDRLEDQPITRQKPYKIIVDYRINHQDTLNTEMVALLGKIALKILEGLHFRIKFVEQTGKLIRVMLVPDWGYWFRTLTPPQSTVMVELEEDVIPI